MASSTDPSFIGCYSLSGLPPSPFTFLFSLGNPYPGGTGGMRPSMVPTSPGSPTLDSGTSTSYSPSSSSDDDGDDGDDGGGDRVQGGQEAQQATASLEACSGACADKGWAVFGYRATRCACGTLVPDQDDQLSSDFCASPCPGQDASLGTCPAGGRWNATSLVNVPPAERRSLRDWRRRDGVTLVWTVHYSNYTSTPDRAASSNSPVSAVPPLPTASTAGADSGGTMDAASASRTKTWLIPVVAIAVVLFLALMALLGWRLHRSRSRRLLGSGMLYPASSDHEKRGYSAGGEVAAVGIRQLPLARIATTRSSLRSYGEEKDWIHSWRSSSIAPTRPSSQGHDLTGDEIVVVERPPDDEVQSAESGELGAGAGKRRSRNGGRPVSGRRPPSTMTTRFSDLVPSGFLLPRSRSIDSTHDVPEGANISTDAICNVGPSNVGVQVNPITVGGADGHTHSDSPPASPTFLAVRRLSRRPTSWLVRRSSRPVSHDGPHAASPLPVRQIKTSFGVGDDDRPSIDVLDPDRRLSTVVGSTTPTPRVSRPRPTSARMVHSDDGHLSHSTSEFAGVTRTLSDHDHGQRHLHGGQDYYPSPLVRSHSAGPSPFAWRDSRYSEHASAHLSREPSSVGHHTVGETGHGVSRSGSGTSSGHWLLGSAPASPARHRSGVDVRRDSVGLGLHAPADEERDVEFVDRRSDDGSDAGVEDESLSFSPSTAAANRLRLATGEQPMHPVYPAQPFFRFAPPSDSNLDASTPRLIATPAATTSEGLEEYERRLGVVPSEGAVSSGSISHTQPGGEAPRFIGQESPRGQGLGMPMWRQRLNSVGSFATLLEDRHKLSLANPDHSTHTQSFDSLPQPPMASHSPSPPRTSFDRSARTSSPRQPRKASGGPSNASLRSRDPSSSSTPTGLGPPLARATTLT